VRVQSRGVVVPERGGTPFPQIFLSRNGDPVNIVYHSTAGTLILKRSANQLVLQKVTLYTKFGQFVLRKIVEIIATRCHILRLKCTKFDFHWGAYDALPDSLAGFKGAYF